MEYWKRDSQYMNNMIDTVYKGYNKFHLYGTSEVETSCFVAFDEKE